MTTHREFKPVPGAPFELHPLLTLVLAPNPSPMTNFGTNTYILGSDPVAVVDPGPDDPTHLAALQAAIGARHVSHILVTHSHFDHSPLARPLALFYDAPVCAYGDSEAGRSAIMQALALDGLVGGGEGVDPDFTPDVALPDNAVITGSWGQITALHTPGHMGNHLCFAWNDTVFTGDLVMAWASSLVSPPDGDLTDFMASCAKLQNRDAQCYYPGHGAPIYEPAARIDWLIGHRRTRENQILTALAHGGATAERLMLKIYEEIGPALHPAATRNVFAHLIDLHVKGLVTATPALSPTAVFRLDQEDAVD